ncbi:MAG: hypothetical protein AB1847_17490 [bacterium]
MNTIADSLIETQKASDIEVWDTEVKINNERVFRLDSNNNQLLTADRNIRIKFYEILQKSMIDIQQSLNLFYDKDSAMAHLETVIHYAEKILSNNDDRQHEDRQHNAQIIIEHIQQVKEILQKVEVK